MECCRRTGDRSFPLRLPVRASASADPGHRGDLPNTFGQLSSSNPTPIRRRLHLLRVGRWNSDGSIRAMILDLSDEQTRAPLNFLVETIEADRLLAGSATHDRQRDPGRARAWDGGARHRARGADSGFCEMAP